VLERLGRREFTGLVVLEVSTRRARTRADRAALLAESLLFARLNLEAAGEPGRGAGSGRPARPPAASAGARDASLSRS
jgi:hypothetical protein